MAFTLPSTTCFKAEIIIGDFNSHHYLWGYANTCPNGEAVKSWAESNKLRLIHDAKLPKSSISRRLQKGHNPDICFASENIAPNCHKLVCTSISHYQHRPIEVKISSLVNSTTIPFRRRFNFKKANWLTYSEDLDKEIENLVPTCNHYTDFSNAIKNAPHKFIPRGCRANFIPGLSAEHMELYNKCQSAYNTNPFSKTTTALCEQLVDSISDRRRKTWRALIEETDMRHSSRKAWKTIKILSTDYSTPKQYTNITPNQIAYHLIMNGKSLKAKTKSAKLKLKPDDRANQSILDTPFSMSELELGMKDLKIGTG